MPYKLVGIVPAIIITVVASLVAINSPSLDTRAWAVIGIILGEACVVLGIADWLTD